MNLLMEGSILIWLGATLLDHESGSVYQEIRDESHKMFQGSAAHPVAYFATWVRSNELALEYFGCLDSSL